MFIGVIHSNLWGDWLFFGVIGVIDSGVNYNDLTVTSLESWLVREIIPKWP